MLLVNMLTFMKVHFVTGKYEFKENPEWL